MPSNGDKFWYGEGDTMLYGTYVPEPSAEYVQGGGCWLQCHKCGEPWDISSGPCKCNLKSKENSDEGDL